jgi:hypothetical protein
MSRRYLLALLCCTPGVVFSVCTTAPRAARADLVTSYNVFAAHEVRLSGTINNSASFPGPIGSNHDVRLGASGKFQSLAGGGTLYGTGTGAAISGNVTFAQDVTLGALTTVGGDLSAGSNANLQGTIDGDAIAGGTATSTAHILGNLLGAGGVSTSGVGLVGGSLLSDGNVHVGANVAANVNYGVGKSYSISPGKSVGGSVTSSNVAITPSGFDPVIMPAAHSITTGATNIALATFATRTISPGHYGHVTLAGSNTLNLSAGDYYFSDIIMNGSFLTLNYNLTSGPIHVYVKGNAVFNNANTHVNGVNYNAINPALAPQIQFEAQGALTVSNSSLFGTFYAPFGDITIQGLSNFTGGVYSGHDIIADGANFSFGSGSNSCVPEPSSYLLLAMALVAGLPMLRTQARRRRTSRAARERGAAASGAGAQDHGKNPS